MNSHKQTKRALLTSVMALAMCVVMLVGTTLAWFTDTASTSVNKIQAGNLDIELQMKDAKGNWINAEGETLPFLVEGKIPDVGTQIFWEPGCTYYVPEVRVLNKGKLAVKFEYVNELLGVTGKLAEVLEPVFKTPNDGAGNPIDIEPEVLKPGEASPAWSFGYHMKETAGNEYQNETASGMCLTVVATQATYEKDSKDDQYDKDATYPVVAKNQAEVNNAITNTTEKNVTIAVPAGQTTTLDNGIANEGSKSRNVTFIGDGSQTVDVAKNAPAAEGAMHLNYQRGSTFTFENLTIENGTDTYDGIVCDELTYKNCTIKGVTTLYGKATFIDCVFENTMTNQYSIWTWGGTDVTFENCTFNTNGKAILLFGEDKTTSLTVNNCKFYDRTDGAAGKAAIEIGDANYGKHNNFTVVINNSTVEQGFAINANGTNTGSKLWANKNSMDAAHLTVTIDGGKVQ